MSKSLVPINVIADDICADMEDTSGRYKFRITRLLMDAYRDMHLYTDQEFDVKTAVLEVNNAIEMPCDFVYETKVGVLYKGHLAVLTLDKSIHQVNLTQTESETQLNNIFNGDYNYDIYPFYNVFRNGQNVGELYGYGRGVNCQGLYNIDKKTGTIYIGSLVPKDAEIVVEYKSDGVSEGLKLIPSEQVRALKHLALADFYIHSDPNKSAMNRQLYEGFNYRINKLYNFRNALQMAETINSMFSPSNY